MEKKIGGVGGEENKGKEGIQLILLAWITRWFPAVPEHRHTVNNFVPFVEPVETWSWMVNLQVVYIVDTFHRVQTTDVRSYNRCYDMSPLKKYMASMATMVWIAQKGERCVLGPNPLRVFDFGLRSSTRKTSVIHPDLLVYILISRRPCYQLSPHPFDNMKPVGQKGNVSAEQHPTRFPLHRVVSGYSMQGGRGTMTRFNEFCTCEGWREHICHGISIKTWSFAGPIQPPEFTVHTYHSGINKFNILSSA